MKKYLIIAAIVAASIASSASAASGSTSTGSTSTGSTSTGVVAPALTCSTGLACAGGPSRAYNFTTKQLDMVPQCFPWVWLLEYYKGNIFDMYRNQETCRAQRKIDFGM